MDLCITPGPLRGAVTPPPSKSLLHREMIVTALSHETIPVIDGLPEDALRTQEGLAQMGEEMPTVDCGASGTTLRLLLPLFMALGKRAVFTGTKRLLSRPLPPGLPYEKTTAGLQITGALFPGDYPTPGDVSSQFTSGLLLSLPLLAGDSRIVLTTPLASRPYVEMTLAAMARRGVRVEETDGGYFVPGNQIYRPAPFYTEPDWSAAAYYIVMNALGSRIDIQNMALKSRQGDQIVEKAVKKMKNISDISQNFNLSDCPDLLPPLALLAALLPGKTIRFTGCGRLRGKESDRIHTVCETLNALGGKAFEEPDGLRTEGISTLSGGKVDSFDDHRIALLAAAAATVCQKAVILRNAGCVDKSYPNFWKDYVNLGGRTEVLAP